MSAGRYQFHGDVVLFPTPKHPAHLPRPHVPLPVWPPIIIRYTRSLQHAGPTESPGHCSLERNPRGKAEAYPAQREAERTPSCFCVLQTHPDLKLQADFVAIAVQDVPVLPPSRAECRRSAENRAV
ncbi:hypothetical protein SKAU_G00316700 [Synaphobranchus kaupii]|uniref:Uncharacterized protein n=1 Tax=Synaphobranchus kaupii TaxID=118154 RepID=A0A9Q1ESS2_SYNKA|nr:hypothetical protein SKAU_G00316700 [Synaphobranchus kaupii]